MIFLLSPSLAWRRRKVNDQASDCLTNFPNFAACGRQAAQLRRSGSRDIAQELGLEPVHFLKVRLKCSTLG